MSPPSRPPHRPPPPIDPEAQAPLIARLTEELLAGRSAEICRIFADWGAPPPEVELEPEEASLPDERLRFLLRYWRELPRRPGADLPEAAAVDALAMKPALGYVMLLDVLDGGRDFRYRVYPTEVARAAGADHSGKRTSEIPFTASALFYLASYRATIARRRPLYSRHASPPHVNVHHWDRLVLPLADAEGRVIRFLVGNVPGPYRPAA